MSELEDKHAKPAMKDLILSDSGVLLQAERLKSIANFAFKSAVIADHASVPNPKLSAREPFFPAHARYAFREFLAIPGAVQLWLAAFKESGHGLFRAVNYPRPANVKPGFEIYAVTFGAGFLLFQVVASRWVGIEVPFLRPGVTQGPGWDRFSTPFWPANGRAVFWPPDRQLDLTMAHKFGTRWLRTSIPADRMKVD
jgi:hypothetical protein